MNYLKFDNTECEQLFVKMSRVYEIHWLTFPMKGTRWCSHMEENSMFRCMTISSVSSSKMASFNTSAIAQENKCWLKCQIDTYFTIHCNAFFNGSCSVHCQWISVKDHFCNKHFLNIYTDIQLFILCMSYRLLSIIYYPTNEQCIFYLEENKKE